MNNRSYLLTFPKAHNPTAYRKAQMQDHTEYSGKCWNQTLEIYIFNLALNINIPAEKLIGLNHFEGST